MRDHPEKNDHLRRADAPRVRGLQTARRVAPRIKPRSALVFPLAIIRVFGRWGIFLLGYYEALVAAMNGCMRLYLLYHGPYSLAPKRAKPMKFSMMRAICSLWRWRQLPLQARA